MSTYNFSKEIKEVLDKYDTSKANANPISEDLNLKKKDEALQSDSELEKSAKAGLEEYRIDSIKSINDNASNSINDTKSYIKELNESAEKTQNEIAKSFQNAKKETSNEALRRGLARSSIILEQLKELNSEEAKTASGVYEKLNRDLSDADNKIKELESERKKSLSEFDLKYASKLTFEIEKLKEERDKRADDILEYNNEIERKLYEAKNSAIKSNQDYYYKELQTRGLESSLADTLAVSREKELLAVYEKELKKMTKSEALSLLDNKDFTEPLKADTIRALKLKVQAFSD